MRKFALSLLLLLVGLGGGIALDRYILTSFVPPSNIPSSAEGAFQLMAEAWNIIDQVYVDRTAVENTRLTYGAIDGMVASLGDTGHSRFLTPEMLVAQQNYNEGEFEGIGAYVESNADGLTVIVSPIDNSPAQQAGLLAGDIITAVDDEDVTTLRLNEVVQRVLGPADTQVKLTVYRPSTDAFLDFTITRAHIELQNVTWQQLPGTTLAHVRIAAFSQNVAAELRQALQEVNVANLSGIILDLRNNPGGLLNEAIGTASQFLAEGNVLLEENGQGEQTAVAVESGQRITELPLVVLINEGSASASEIVAGALQDNQRATVLGTTTFGTGTVLNEFPLSDGSAMLLATQQWLTPNGRVIWHQGIIPDIVVEQPPDVRQLRPENERTLDEAGLAASGDQQLLEAIKQLNRQ